MLIYNHKKEFIGIDAIDLNKLGFSNLEDLKLDINDFADFFMKKPGFVHNFKHVNWIDFVACSDSPENAKVIIHINSKNFQCNLRVESLYLIQESSSESFLIYLDNMREISNDGTQNISIDLLESSIPKPIAKAPLEIKPEPIESRPSPSIALDDTFEVSESLKTKNNNLNLDKPLNLDFMDQDEELSEDDFKLDLEEKPQVQVKTITKEVIYDNGYLFDPLVASSELGLPVELIEEFIEDFIAQANEFKDELFTSYSNGDNDQLKILSHKLKGVAANLRIEDALETLSIINTSENDIEIKDQLDTFYKIISKLSGEKIQITEDVVENIAQETPAKVIPNIDTLDLDLEFKEDVKIEINDNEVPEKIHMPELADDDFLLSIDEETQIEEKIEIEEEIEISFADEDIELVIEKEIKEETLEILETSEIQEETLEILETPEIQEETLEILETPEIQEETLEILETPEIKKEFPEILYDKSYVANEIGLDKDSFDELFEDYIQESQDLLKSISSAVKTQNIQTWKNQAFKLKGMSDNMRIPSFSKELEILIKTQDSTEANNAHKDILEKLTQISKIKA